MTSAHGVTRETSERGSSGAGSAPLSVGHLVFAGASGFVVGAATAALNIATGRTIFAAALAAGISFLAVVTWSRRLTLAMLVIILPFARGKWFGDLYVNSLTVLLLAATFIFLLGAPLRRCRGAWVAYLMFGWLLLGVAYTRYPAHGFSEGLEILGYAGFFLLVSNTVLQTRDLAWLTNSLMASGILTALFALPQVWLGNRFLFSDIVPLDAALGVGTDAYRIAGPWLHPSWLGEHMALVLIVAFVGRSRVAGWRLLPVATIAICLPAFYFSYSRTAWLALASVIAMYVVSSRLRETLRFALLLGIVLGGLVASSWALGAPITEAIQLRFAQLSESNFSMRTLVWPNAIDMLLSNPIRGVGLGSFGTVFAEHYHVHWFWVPEHAHNVYLQVACQHGIVGLVLFLGTLAVAVRGYLRSQVTLDPAVRESARALFYAFVGALAMGAADHQYADFRLGLLFFGIPAALCAAGGLAQFDSTDRVREPANKL